MIQIKSIKCQYQQINIILINKLFIKINFINNLFIIISVPRITWVMWNKVNKKKTEKKIELVELKFKNLYSINWIEIK